MSSKPFQNTRSYSIYSALQNAKLFPNISANYDSKEVLSPQKSKAQSQKNSSSLILYDYETTLKKQIEQTKLKEQLKKQRRRHKTLEAMYLEQKMSRKIQSNLSSELESIKYNLRSLSMLKESAIQKKEKMILLQSHLQNQNSQSAQIPYPQQIMPYYNPIAIQTPYNAYYQYYPQNQYNPYSCTQPYQPPLSQSHKNIAESPKYMPSSYMNQKKKKLLPNRLLPQTHKSYQNSSLDTRH